MSPDVIAPIVRILLRYAGGVLIARGLAHDPATFADPDLIQAGCYLGAGLCVVVSEGWWWLARKRGWER